MSKEGRVRHVLKSIVNSKLVSMILLPGTLWAVKLARRKAGRKELQRSILL